MAISICSRQFQFTHGNFNLLTAISIYPRQFQFAHGNFNYSNFNFTHGDFNINSRQFHNFTQGNFNFFKATLTPFFASLTTCQLYMAANSGHAPKVKKQNYQKWIVKVDLQREKWKSQSKVDLRTSRTGGYLHETGTNSDWYEFVSVAIHFFSCVYRPKNELRPVWLHLGRWPDMSYFRAGLRPYRSHIKQKTNLRPGP